MAVAFIDIDGVLNEYPKTWLDFIAEKTGLHFDTLDEAKEKLPHRTYTKLKHEYRISGYKLKLKVRDGASDFLRMLEAVGIDPILYTSRPVNNYFNLYMDTINWLEKNGLSFRHIIFGKELIPFYQIKLSPIFVVEDELEYAEIFSKLSLVFLYNGNVERKNIIPVRSFNQIIEFFGWDCDRDFMEKSDRL